MINFNSKIYVAGHTGLVGSAIVRKLKKKGYKKIIFSDRKKLDLTNQPKVYKYLNKNKPKFVFTIMIDNPKPQEFSGGRATGGWVVAPVVKKLVTRIAPILDVKPQLESSSKFSNNLLNYKIRGKNKGAKL